MNCNVCPRASHIGFVIAIGTLLAGASGGAVPPVAFPGAEGFGAYAKGGRGGQVLFVTDLRDYRRNETPIPGSLRAAVETRGARTVVFRVSGVIALKAPLRITHPFITIAGQTAPGDGICLKDYPLVVTKTHDVVLRHLRIRPGENRREEIDALIIAGSENVIVDHCSTSWSTDEVLSPDGKNITVQWCIISEGLDRSFHPKGRHSKGSIIRSADGGITFHHNLYAHNADRNPKMESQPNQPGLLLDFRNNVINNWGHQTGYSGRDHGQLNYIANFLKPGPSSSRDRRYAFRPGGEHTKVFLQGNVLADNPKATANNDRLIRWEGASLDPVRVRSSFPAPTVTMQSADEAFRLVLAQAGAIQPRRDAIDGRIVEEVERGAGRIIDSQSDVGGWPALASAPAPTDSDADGMPDEWEMAHGLNPNRPNHNEDPDGDGYTNLEEYLNGTHPQQPDASPDHSEYRAVLARVADLHASIRSQITQTVTREKHAAAERRPQEIVVNLSPVAGATPERLNVAVAGALPLPMVLIPAGKFLMGSPRTEVYRKNDETQHEVTITKPFYLGVYTVTRRQFAAAMKLPAPGGRGGDLPQTAPWSEAAWFCKNLFHATGRTFRLPTEAEWEYACRAGTTTPFHTGETISTEQANFNGDRIYGPGTRGVYRDRATPPGTFPPNSWGVSDMHGNAYEWCSDWIAPYPKGHQVDPQGPATGQRRVIRGGNFSSHPAYLRSASRYDYDPKVEFAFRLVLEAKPSGSE